MDLGKLAREVHGEREGDRPEVADTDGGEQCDNEGPQLERIDRVRGAHAPGGGSVSA